jgi:DNA-binding winged helix-turn-helix (wHTH) protein
VRYRFGEFELDAASYTLTRAGVSVRAWPKVLDVLGYLVDQRGRLVTKQELLDALWPGSHVDEVAVPWTISHARRALGQRGGEKSPIETVHGRGYRFTAPVELLSDVVPVSPQKTAQESIEPDVPFVGREDVMQRLDARLLDAKKGKGGFCLLVGAAGIGKTRCMDELAAHAAAEGFNVWEGRSVEDAWAPVFWPWVQIVRAAIRDRRALAERAEALLARLGVVGGDAADSDESLRTQDDNFWWVDGVSRLLLDAAVERPILLLLDDVHWADAATIDLLAFLAPDLRRVPVLVVATERDGNTAVHGRTLKRLSRHAERIELGPLRVDDVAQYIRRVAHTNTLGAEFDVAVHRATAGNPLFLQQTIRTLVARHGESALGSLSPDVVEPATVARDVLGAWLQVLDVDTRELLALGSVLGESFDVATLQRLSDQPIEGMLASLDNARAEGFLIAEEPITFRFCHALLRSILYNGMPTDQRVIQHRRAAEILERFGGSARHGEIAHHYHRSLPLGDSERVMAAATHAARVAARMQAFVDATMYADWALAAQALQHDATPRARAELLLFSAQMQWHAGMGEEAQRTIDFLIAIARPHRFFDLLVRAARILRHTHVMGAIEDPLVRGILEEVLEHAPEGASDVRISALSQLSWVPPYGLDIARSKELSGRALELAREFGDEVVLLRALNARLYALSGPDDIDALFAVADEMLGRSRGLSGWVTAAALGARYGAQLYRGDMAGADATNAELGHVSRTRQWPAAIWYHERLSAQRSLLSGDLAAASTALTALRERGGRLRVSYAPMLSDLLQGLLMIEQHGTALLAGSTDLTQLRSQLQDAPVSVRPSIARLLLELGDPASAKAVLDMLAKDDFASVPKEINYLNALANLAVLAINLGDRARAERLYELLVPYAAFNTPNIMLLYEGSVSHFLGLLAVYLKRDDTVERHFDDALAMNERLGQRPQLARTCDEYSRWLLTRGDQTAHHKAQDLHARALALAEATGMTSFLARLTSTPK